VVDSLCEGELVGMGKEIDFIRANKVFKDQFNKFCLEHNLDTFQAIRILSKTIEETAHQARITSIFTDEE